jgi:hypothetical protein
MMCSLREISGTLENEKHSKVGEEEKKNKHWKPKNYPRMPWTGSEEICRPGSTWPADLSKVHAQVRVNKSKKRQRGGSQPSEYYQKNQPQFETKWRYTMGHLHRGLLGSRFVPRRGGDWVH